MPIPRLGQVLVQVSPEHLQGWRSSGPSGHLCQRWTTQRGWVHTFLICNQNFPCCKLCPLPLALCCSEKSLDQSSLKSLFKWLMTSGRPSPFSVFSFRLRKHSFLSFSSYPILQPPNHLTGPLHLFYMGSPKLYTLIFLFSSPLTKYLYSSLLFTLSLPVTLAITFCPQMLLLLTWRGFFNFCSLLNPYWFSEQPLVLSSLNNVHGRQGLNKLHH